jgi:ubiquinone/menaquinone biosynthesis C-methylase UbiE
VFVADALTLPYRAGSCDAALCIAVLHHISSVQRRIRLLEQLAGVLRPGGCPVPECSAALRTPLLLARNACTAAAWPASHIWRQS